MQTPLLSVRNKTPTFSLFLQQKQLIYTSKRPVFVASNASNSTFSYQTLSFLTDTTYKSTSKIVFH